MKKYLYITLGLAFAGLMLSSCKKEAQNPYEGEATPTISISAVSTAFENDKADLMLELSHFIHKNVEVYFEVEGTEAEALDLPSPMVFQAGSVKKKFTVTINEELSPLGKNYPVTIKIKEAVGATVDAAASSASVNMTNNDFTTVGLSGVDFNEEGEGSILVNLGKKLATDLSVTFAVSDQTINGAKPIDAADLSFESTVTVPAGNRSFRVPVSYDTDAAALGMNQAVFTLASCGDNAQIDETAIAYLNFMASLNMELNEGIEVGYLETHVWAAPDVLNTKPYFGVILIPASEGSADDIVFLEKAIQADAIAIASGTGTAYSFSAAETESKYLFPVSANMGEYMVITYTMDESYNPAGGFYNVTTINVGATPVSADWFMYYYYSGYDYYYHYVYNAAETGYYLFFDTSKTEDFDSEEEITAKLLELEAAVASGSKTLATGTGYQNWSYRSSLTSGATYYCFMFEFTADGKATGRYCKDEVTIP